MEFQHSVGFQRNLLELMEEGKVLTIRVDIYKCTDQVSEAQDMLLSLGLASTLLQPLIDVGPRVWLCLPACPLCSSGSYPTSHQRSSMGKFSHVWRPLSDSVWG